MFEKVNPSHPDKVADRIAGAMVDLAYLNQKNPKVAIEVLIGHGTCHIIAESSYAFSEKEVQPIVDRIDGKHNILDLKVFPQDSHLANNQLNQIRCGDNGIFKGSPITEEQNNLNAISKILYGFYPYDGKYLLANEELTICQSHMKDNKNIYQINDPYFKKIIINPLGEWTGGTNVDTGATNRKLGSDMGDGITGGGLHGKDLSKADVAVNIFAFLEAQEKHKIVEYHCSIGDEKINGIPYSDIVKEARSYIYKLGGFEKFAEWGLLR